MAVSPNSVFDPVNVDQDGPVFLGLEKPLLTIFQELNALSAAKKTAIWNAFTAGNPPLWAKDGADGLTWGRQAPALAAASVMAVDFPLGGAWTAALQTMARLKMVAVYLLDNPLWLQEPVFDPTINVVPFVPPAP